MSKPVSLYDAKTHLSELVERAAGGEEIVITKAGKPELAGFANCPCTFATLPPRVSCPCIIAIRSTGCCWRRPWSTVSHW